jgi:pimeloyl-ACP methyl ester carboxylesterase
MTKLALIPGAGHNAKSMWPLQAMTDKDILPLDYRQDHQLNPYELVLDQYAKNALAILIKNDEPVHLCGISMGALIALRVADLAKEKSGLIEGVSLINPGVFGGSISYFSSPAFYLACFSLFWSTQSEAARRKMRALQEVRKVFPNFIADVPEETRAMTEAINGMIGMPKHLFGKVNLFCSSLDELIPWWVSEILAQRAGVEIHKLTGHYHNVCLHDFEGKILKVVLKAANLRALQTVP